MKNCCWEDGLFLHLQLAWVTDCPPQQLQVVYHVGFVKMWLKMLTKEVKI